MIDQRRLSAVKEIGSFNMTIDDNDSDDGGRVPEFGKYKHVPDI